MYKLHYLLGLVLLHLCSFFLQANDPDGKSLLAPNQLREDAFALRYLLETHHPGLYQYQTPQQFDSLFQSVVAQLDRPMNRESFLKALNPLLIAVRCGHTRFVLDQSLVASENEAVFFPLEIRLIGEEAYIEKQWGISPILPKGARLASINGKDFQQILQDLLPQIPTDGYIETSRTHELGQAFWLYYRFFVGPSSHFRIQYQTREGDLLEAHLAAITYETRQQAHYFSPLSLQILQSSPAVPSQTAVLRVASFSNQELGETKQNFSDFLEKSFESLKKNQVENLVLDLRNNSGGEDTNGALLLSYLSTEPFRYYHQLEIKPASKKQLPFWARLTMGTQKRSGETWMLKNHPNLKWMQPQKNAFSGNIFVLVNGGSFSATSQFCSNLKAKGKAVFIGEETGGASGSNSSGVILDFGLPHTELVIKLPFIQYYFAETAQQKGRGVMPDYPVAPQPEDWFNGRDPEIDFTFRLISKQMSLKQLY